MISKVPYTIWAHPSISRNIPCFEIRYWQHGCIALALSSLAVLFENFEVNICHMLLKLQSLTEQNASLIQVLPKDIPSPKHSDLPLNAYLLHNLAHVELNAIDLAWDTVVRFSPYSEHLGEEFFHDFAHVADDESRHFAWCLQRLAELGFRLNISHDFLMTVKCVSVTVCCV